MKKIDKRVWYAIPIVLGIYLIYKQFASSKSNPNPSPNPNPNPSPNPQPVQSSSYPLKKGSKDAGSPNNPNGLVVDLQRLINSYGGYRPKVGFYVSLPLKLTQDGAFGSNTEWAVEQYTGKKTVDNNADLLSLEQKLIKKQQEGYFANPQIPDIFTNPNLHF